MWKPVSKEDVNSLGMLTGDQREANVAVISGPGVCMR